MTWIGFVKFCWGEDMETMEVIYKAEKSVNFYPYIKSISKKYDYDALPGEQKRKVIQKIKEDTLENSNRFYPDVKVRKSFYTAVVKRVFDILISGIALVVSFPVNLIIGVVTVFDVGLPIFFIQKRIGKDHKPFNLIKFRNMNNKTDENGTLLKAELRVSGWGRFVRSTSLDELLNFISIFKGDMSLIGPRPLPVEYESRFNSYHNMRHAVKPGLDCPLHDPSQYMTWENRLNNDVWYVENISFMTDIKLIGLLIRETLFGIDKGIRSGGSGEGSFMGYFDDGKIMDSNNIPDRYYEEVFIEPEKAEEGTEYENFRYGESDSAVIDQKIV